ncbi:hypothetical protein PQX77_012157 [Marasmius sp. AFHP31]|nr:hypothetical protein PQX77_012157 [Marasmius sp. AFHP31]
MPNSKDPDQAKKPRGRESWVKGEKLEYLVGLEKIWRENSQTMYRVATKEFLDRWGYDLRPEAAPEPGAVYTVKDINKFPEGKERDDEEIRREDRRKEIYGMISNWARYRWRKKKIDVSAITTIMRSMTDLRGGSYPRRAQDIQYYHNKYWESKFRTEFETYWNVAKKRMSPKARLREMNRFVEQKLSQETEAYQEEIRAEVESKYKQEVDEYNRRQQWENSASGYNEVWKNADSFLPYLVDALAKFTGSGVSLFLYGPRDKGEIECDSISSVVPDTQTTHYLKDFDEEAYSAFHNVCQRFAQATFSKEYCKSRIVSERPATSSAEGEDPDSDEVNDDASQSTGRVFRTVNSEPLQVVGADGRARPVPKTLEAPKAPKNVTSGSPPKIRKNVGAPSNRSQEAKHSNVNTASFSSVTIATPTTPTRTPVTIPATPPTSAATTTTTTASLNFVIPSAPSDHASTMPPDAQNLLPLEQWGEEWLKPENLDKIWPPGGMPCLFDDKPPHLNWQGQGNADADAHHSMATAVVGGHGPQMQSSHAHRPATGPAFYDNPPQLFLSSSCSDVSTSVNVAATSTSNTGMSNASSSNEQFNGAIVAGYATHVGTPQDLHMTHENFRPGTNSILQDLPAGFASTVPKPFSRGKENDPGSHKTVDDEPRRPEKRSRALDNTVEPSQPPKKTRLSNGKDERSGTGSGGEEDGEGGDKGEDAVLGTGSGGQEDGEGNVRNGETAVDIGGEVSDVPAPRSKRAIKPPARFSEYELQTASSRRKRAGPADTSTNASSADTSKATTKRKKTKNQRKR